MNLTPQLKQQIQQDPEKTYRVIVRVSDDLDAAATQLKSKGFQIHRRLFLVKGFAASASGAAIQQLAQEPWVTQIELDQQVGIR